MVRILTTRGCTEKNRNRHGELLKGTSVLLRWRISQKASLDCYAIIETRHICIKGGNIPPPPLCDSKGNEAKEGGRDEGAQCDKREDVVSHLGLC